MPKKRSILWGGLSSASDSQREHDSDCAMRASVTICDRPFDKLGRGNAATLIVSRCHSSSFKGEIGFVVNFVGLRRPAHRAGTPPNAAQLALVKQMMLLKKAIEHRICPVMVRRIKRNQKRLIKSRIATFRR